jgi:hypothetical protein
VDLDALLDDLLARLSALLTAPPALSESIARARLRLETGREGAVLLPDGSRRAGVVVGVTDEGGALVRSGAEVWSPPFGSEFTTSPDARSDGSQ